jgi:mono/diheme cytochrome c family protein
MKSLVVAMLLAPAWAWAQPSAPSPAARGLDVFNKSCATGYCHGVKGTPGGAPRLAARGFDDAYISQTVRNGIAGTGMPAFGMTLDRADLLAVIAYVDNLNGVTPPPNPFAMGREARKLPPEAQRGRQLFVDQVRGFQRCSTCHQADRIGIPVALPFSSVPENVAALRAVATPQVETATADGDSFPALPLNKSGAEVKLYDLKTLPPVLRTFPKGSVTFKEGSSWRHEAMLAPYNDQELEAILAFLRATSSSTETPSIHP